MASSTNTQSSQDIVPVYHLYGEDQQWLTPDMVHCEGIASRSRLHNWEIKPHRHHGLFQILWLESGSAMCQLDDEQALLEASRILLVPQHCVHGFRFSPDASGQVLTLAYPLFTRLGTELGRVFPAFSAPVVCDMTRSGERVQIEATLRMLAQEYHGHGSHRRTLVEALLTALLVWLLRRIPVSASHERAWPARGRKYLMQFSALIESDFASHHPLKHYAQKIGISTAHLNALCRQLTSRSALYLIQERIALEARRNLVYTTMTISTVADALGFADPAYFTRFFKRHTGMSPKAFRLQAVRLVGEGNR